MKKDWKRWLEDERVRKLFRRDNLLILILAGILLFIIALPTKEDGAAGEGIPGGTETAAGAGGDFRPAQGYSRRIMRHSWKGG